MDIAKIFSGFSVHLTMPMTIFLLCAITKSILGELPPEQYKRLCYFNNWSQDRDKVAQLMPEQVTPRIAFQTHDYAI